MLHLISFLWNDELQQFSLSKPFWLIFIMCFVFMLWGCYKIEKFMYFLLGAEDE